MDLMPTMLDLAGIESPEDRPLDGTSLRPILFAEKNTAESVLAKRTLFWNGQVARQGKWKLVHAGKKNSRTQLFNLADDLGETTNVAADNQEIVTSLKSSLADWRREVSNNATKQP
jgi:arylsulfatase A-like enzyme